MSKGTVVKINAEGKTLDELLEVLPTQKRPSSYHDVSRYQAQEDVVRLGSLASGNPEACRFLADVLEVAQKYSSLHVEDGVIKYRATPSDWELLLKKAQSEYDQQRKHYARMLLEDHEASIYLANIYAAKEKLERFED